MTIFSFYNVTTTLASAITSGATSIDVSSSSGLPSSVPSGTVIALGIGNATGTTPQFEIVYVTAISGTTLTIERGQEGTTAQAFASGSYVNSVTSSGQQSNFAQLPRVNNTFPVGISAGGSGTSISVTTATFTAPSNGNLVILVVGWAYANSNSGITVSTSLGTPTSLDATAAGIGAHLTAYLQMTAGQSTTVSSTLTNSASTNYVLGIICFFQPTP